jgi:HSP20 family protein
MATDTRNKNEQARKEHPERQPAPRSNDMAQRPRDMTRHDRDWERSSFSPFSVMRQGIDEMERWLGQLGWARGWASPSGWTPSGRGFMSQMARPMGDWSPAIDAYQRGNEFVIRAEVPGMQRQDLTVEVGDDAVTLHGERKREFEEDREGVFWTERSYGSFTRVIPLPPGVIGDSAKATFNNGILEIVMKAPSAEERRGRRLDISGA